MNKKPFAAGKSSFNLVDTKSLFAELEFKEDTKFLDVACGSGSYSIAASEYIGQQGNIFAFDLSKESIDSLQKEISIKKIENIYAGVVNVNKHIPVEDGSIDVCLMATVLHDLIQDKTDEGTLREIKRVLKPKGKLAIVEFKKIEGPPGPPAKFRISPEDLEKYLKAYSFHLIKKIDVGQYNYLSVFSQ